MSDKALDSMVPRGGHCKSCHNYVLWGDVVKGMYRRHIPLMRQKGKKDEIEEEGIGDEEDITGEVFGSDLDDEAEENKALPRARAESKSTASLPATIEKSKTKRRPKDKTLPPQVKERCTHAVSKKSRQADDASSEGEMFDFGGIASLSTSSESDAELPIPHYVQPSRSSPPKRPRVKGAAALSVDVGKIRKRKYHSGLQPSLSDANNDDGLFPSFDECEVQPALVPPFHSSTLYSSVRGHNSQADFVDIFGTHFSDDERMDVEADVDTCLSQAMSVISVSSSPRECYPGDVIELSD